MRIARRFGLTAAAAAAVGLAAASGCNRETAKPAPKPAALAAAVVATPVLKRADLLSALDVARAAYAAGAAAPEETLTGRRFSIREAFGCEGPLLAVPDGLARWNWDRQRQAVEVSLAPADWSTSPLLAGANGQPMAKWEAVEGFWLTRSWLPLESCPAPPIIAPSAQGAVQPSSPATAPTVGIAAVFAVGSSRVGRRDGRAYTLTQRGEPTAAIPIGGYRLLLEGRFIAFPDGQPIHCRTDNADAEPVCIAAAEVDRVAVEDAAGKVLRDWRSG